MEYHPRINENTPRIKESRIILGSFPTWALTAVDSDKKETEEEKLFVRTSNSDFLYFFGSSTNKFWDWYKIHVDGNIETRDSKSIQRSLVLSSIGITDMLLTCERKNRSALDKNLIKRKYNHNFFEYPKTNETLKILCTSKGVLNQMLLTKTFFKLHPKLSINELDSQTKQAEIIKNLKGESRFVVQPFFKKLDVKDGGSIECLAIPSPGSPYRKLDCFGNFNMNLDNYLKNYLSYAFRWFIT